MREDPRSNTTHAPHKAHPRSRDLDRQMVRFRGHDCAKNAPNWCNSMPGMIGQCERRGSLCVRAVRSFKLSLVDELEV